MSIIFNKQQRLAIDLQSDSVCVVAGAGTGKTGLITHKIFKLQSLGCSNVLALTFTNKAVLEMRSRLKQMLKIPKRMNITTFHALGLNILKEYCEHVGLRSKFSIFDSYDSINLLKDITNNKVDLAQLHAIKSQISIWKNTTVDASQWHADDPYLKEVALKYEELLGIYNAVDFDDLVYKSYKLCVENEMVRKSLQVRFGHILIDEYQDTNLVQYNLFKLLLGPDVKFTVVGDDDQSIYGWRGAVPENMRQIQLDFPDMKVVKLEQNYRCSTVILEAANSVIAENDHIFNKKLWSELGGCSHIKLASYQDDNEEAAMIADSIAIDKIKRNLNYSDFAILFRNNHQAFAFEKALRLKGIPYITSGLREFFDKPEIKLLLSYFRLLLNPDDDQAFLRVINNPKRNIGAKTISILVEYANARNRSLLSILDEIGLQRQMNAKVNTVLSAFAQLIGYHSKQILSDSSELSSILHKFIDELEYREWIIESNDKASASRKLEDLVAFLNWLEQLGKQQPHAQIFEILQKIIILDIIDNQDKNKNRDRVSLMTLHSAKGLEFKSVYLVGLEEGTLPYVDANLSEERRLFYVGITRAREKLSLSYKSTRRRGKITEDLQPSIFLKDIPKHLLLTESSEQISSEVGFANLRALLD